MHFIELAAGNRAGSNLELIRGSRERLRLRVSETITFAAPYIFFKEKGLIYPNTINIVQGKQGSHKSRLVELFCAVMLSEDPAQVEKVSWIRRGSNTQKFRVVYIDTERNEKDQFPYALQQIQLKAGFRKEDRLENFDFFSFIGVQRSQRHLALQEYLIHELKASPDEAVIVILDVITDCLSNFNDSSDSLQLLDFLNMQISDHNITFICVIHENPGSGNNKPRGHVGTELQNKASSQLQIGYEQDGTKGDTDLIKVLTIKNRVNARQEPVYLRYDEEECGLVLADDELIRQAKDNRRTKLNSDELMQYLIGHLLIPTTSGDLIRMIQEHFSCCRGTALDRVKELVEDGNRQMIAADVKGPRLEKFRQGRKELYSIVYPTVFGE